MKKEKVNIETCTREQFVEIVRAAKKRKEEWERRVQAEMLSRQRMKEQAYASHYYDIGTI
jgi:hypothetical protein